MTQPRAVHWLLHQESMGMSDPSNCLDKRSGGIRPHICWFGEVPFELDRIFRALDECTVFMAVGPSGVGEPVARFVANGVAHRTTIHVGEEQPANASAFTECHLGKAGEVLPRLFDV